MLSNQQNQQLRGDASINFENSRAKTRNPGSKFDVSVLQKFQFMGQNRNSSDNKILDQKNDYTFKIDKKEFEQFQKDF